MAQLWPWKPRQSMCRIWGYCWVLLGYGSTNFEVDSQWQGLWDVLLLRQGIDHACCGLYHGARLPARKSWPIALAVCFPQTLTHTQLPIFSHLVHKDWYSSHSGRVCLCACFHIPMILHLFLFLLLFFCRHIPAGYLPLEIPNLPCAGSFLFWKLFCLPIPIFSRK